MQIIVNTDNQVESRPRLVEKAESEVRSSVGHFSDQVTRVEVHLSELGKTKTGASDKRCTLEARLAGHQPVAAHHDAESFDQAITGAAKKLHRVIDHTVGRMTDSKGRESIRTADALVEEMPQVGSDAGS